MTELQWALIVIGGVAVIGIYFYTRRDRALKNWTPPNASDSPLKPKPPTKEQMEMFQRSGKFDEFGLGKPRVAGDRRRPPDLAPGQSAVVPAAVAMPAPVAATLENLAAKIEPPKPQDKPVIARYEEKYFALLIAEREGTNIYGEKLHNALRAQKLEFGARDIYHRLDQGMVQFSVASLLQPGTLDPAQAAAFSTPGLSVFMLLPGPVKPLAAFDDMVKTARLLASSLNAEVFNVQRQALNEESARALRAEVEAWARGQNLG